MMNYMRFPGGKSKVLTLSYDDGVNSDIRFIDILDRHGIKCTFNINTGLFGLVSNPIHKRLSKEDAIKVYSNPNHEVAVHTLTHPFLEQMPIEACTYEVLQDRINLEQMFGKPIRGMAYPFGTYSDDVVETLKSCGIVYSRTTLNDFSFKLPKDWLRLVPTCHHRNPQLIELCDKFLEMREDRSPYMFYLWGHTYEFDNANNWDVIENFAEKMGGHDNIWYATNIEIYDYIESYKRLQFTADNTLVYNPTNTELFFYTNIGPSNNKTLSVKPGETIKIK